MRNSLLIAIAPTATIASIAGCYECIEPQVSNLFKRETLSGDFLQVNRYLVAELKALGLWTETMRARLKLGEGSVQALAELPEERARHLPHGLGDADALAHRHGGRSRRVHRSEPVAEPVHREPEHRAALSMYFYAWKQGPQDDLLPALAPGDADRQDHGRPHSKTAARVPATRRRCGARGDAAVAARSRTPRAARPASERRRAGRARLLDPGMCLTLRPMAYPAFFEMYRAAIKNTWTVEEVDFSTDVSDLQRR